MENKKDKTQEELEQEERILRQQRMLNFASQSVSYKHVGGLKSPSGDYTIDQITNALNNPYTSTGILQDVSLFLYQNNGQYSRIIDDIAGTPMYDLYLYPTQILGFTNTKKSKNIDNLNKEYETVATILENVNYKYNLRWMGKYLLLLGELYTYKIEDNDGVIFKLLPTEMCRITNMLSDNIYKFSIDLSKMSNEEIRKTMPEQIQKYYEQYSSGSLDEEKLDGSYYYLEDNEAVAFLWDDNQKSKGVPYLTFLFDKVMRLNQIEDEDLASSLTDNLKLIHQKFDVDDEGNPIIDEEVLAQYHQATKRNLPKNVCITSNPLQVEIHTLQRQSNTTISTTEKALQTIYSSVGMNIEKFSGVKNSNQAIVASILSDEIVAKNLSEIFGNFLNYQIKGKKKKPLWRVQMLHNTYYNKDEFTRNARDNAMIGGNKLILLASQGMTPLCAMSSLIYESALNINQYFIPLNSGYNSSSSTSDSNGRPSAESEGDVKESEN